MLMKRSNVDYIITADRMATKTQWFYDEGQKRAEEVKLFGGDYPATQPWVAILRTDLMSAQHIFEDLKKIVGQLEYTPTAKKALMLELKLLKKAYEHARKTYGILATQMIHCLDNPKRVAQSLKAAKAAKAAKTSYFVTSYCNQRHSTKTGKPVGHKCIIIPPAALRAEIAGNFDEALKIMRASQKKRGW
jgi:hypothetical protein